MIRRLAVLLVCFVFACVGEITGVETFSDRGGQVIVLQGPELADELSQSPVRSSSEPFRRVGAIWEGDRPGAFEISVSVDGESWSSWTPLVVQHVELEEIGGFVGQYELAGELASYYRLRGAQGSVEYIRLELLPTGLSDGVEDGVEGGDDGDESDGVTFSTMIGDAEVHTRSDWGAKDHRCSSGLGSVYRMAIHHTETPTSDSLSPQARLRGIQSYHMDVRGWCDVGYHYLMSRDGRLWQGRPEHLLGAHAGGANSGNVGFSVMGSHDSTPITSTQLNSLATLVRAVALDHGVGMTRGNIKGHRQYKPTSCPGEALYGQLDQLVDVAASGGGGDPPPPPPDPDPDPSCGGPLSTDGAWSCDSLTGSTTNASGMYYTTSFGCWVDELGDAHADAGDNCLPACSLSSIGCAGMTGPDCERMINWYVADSDRFGCGAVLRVTNPDNGKSAVLKVIDRGPSCSIERTVDHWVLDMSYRASHYLFGGPTSATERADVTVEVVASDTPLGPTTSTTCEPPVGGVTVQGVLYAGSDTADRIVGATVSLGARTTTTDSTGLWKFDGVAEGAFTVTASAAGYQTRSVTGATYADVSWASFGLSAEDSPSSGTAVLQGVVYHSGDSSNRIPGASISLSTGHTATADANGFFRITGLPAGAVAITASAAGWTSASVSRSLVDGETEWGSVQLTEDGGGGGGDPTPTTACYNGGATCLPLTAVDPYSYPSPLNANYREPVQYIDMDDPSVDTEARVAANFKLGEICVRSKGRYQVLQRHAVQKLQAVRTAAGSALTINSGFRSPDYNASVGGATRSRHMYGDAFDIMPGAVGQDGLMSICTSHGAGYVAKYASGHIHCDWRSDTVDALFFGTAFAPLGPPMPAWAVSDLRADIEPSSAGSYVAPASGYDETEGELLREWTALDAHGNVLAEATGATFTPPVGTQILRVSIGGLIEVEEGI